MQEISKCLCFRYAPARYFLNFPQAIFQFLFQSVSLQDGRCGDTDPTYYDFEAENDRYDEYERESDCYDSDAEDDYETMDPEEFLKKYLQDSEDNK